MIFAVFVVLVVVFVILPLIGVALWWLLSTLVVGLLMGALGRLIVPGPTRIGFLPTVACGLVGALAGGAAGHAISNGRFVTILLEIGVAAAAVAFWDVTHRRAIGRPRALTGRRW